MVDVRPVLRKPEARMDFGTKCLVPPGRVRLKPTETRTGPEFFKHLSYPSRSSTEFFRRPTATARRGQGLHVRGAEEMRAVAIGRAGRLAFPMRSGSPGWPKAKRHLLLLKNFDLWQSRRAPTGGRLPQLHFSQQPTVPRGVCRLFFRILPCARRLFCPRNCHNSHFLSTALPITGCTSSKLLRSPGALPQPGGERPVVPLCRAEVPTNCRHHDVAHRSYELPGGNRVASGAT